MKELGNKNITFGYLKENVKKLHVFVKFLGF